MRLARALNARGVKIAVDLVAALALVALATTPLGAARGTPVDTTTSARAGGVSVTSYNGGAWVQWSNPPDVAAPRQFHLTATPSDASLQSTIPARVARRAGAIVPGDQHSFFFGGLAADCHTQYTFSVSALDESGVTHVVGTTPLVRPSGYVGRGDPPLVEVVVDGAPSSFEVPAPVTYDPLDQPSYCPEQPLTADGRHLPTVFRPDAIQELLQRWYGISSGLPGAFDAAGEHTNWYLDDAYAATGAVILPFSYRGAILSRDDGGAPQLTVAPYSADDTTNGMFDAQAWTLAQEIESIHRVWRSSRIVVLGHSYGGLVAEWYWQSWWPKTDDHDGVVHVFSLDSPINGISKADVCQENLQALLFCSPNTGYSQTLFGVWSILWDGRAEHDAAIVAVDRSEGLPYTSVYTAA